MSDYDTFRIEKYLRLRELNGRVALVTNITVKPIPSVCCTCGGPARAERVTVNGVAMLYARCLKPPKRDAYGRVRKGACPVTKEVDMAKKTKTVKQKDMICDHIPCLPPSEAAAVIEQVIAADYDAESRAYEEHKAANPLGATAPDYPHKPNRERTPAPSFACGASCEEEAIPETADIWDLCRKMQTNLIAAAENLASFELSTPKRLAVMELCKSDHRVGKLLDLAAFCP